MATELGDRRITGYPDDAPREKKELELKTYAYEFPLNHPNVTLDRVWVGGERHGIKLYPIKTSDGSMRHPGCLRTGSSSRRMSRLCGSR